MPTQPAEPEPWIGYIRVSTWKEEKISPELQQGALQAWAARTGRRLIEPLTVDLDATGRNFNRKIMRDIERVERGEARGIAVWRFSRFGRNRTGNAINLARLEAVGGRLESATEPIEAGTAVGEFQREMIFAFGNFESNRASEQWRETHAHRLEKLKLPATGRPRFGYLWHRRWDPRTETLQAERYTPDPDGAAEAIAEAYERKADGGEGFAVIAAWLNAVGYRTVRGYLWDDTTLKRYMDSGFAAGLLRIHDSTCRCGCPKSCPRWEYLPGAQPPIIDEDLWRRYQAHRRQTAEMPPRARAATYPLSGLMRHGECRGGMGAHQRATKDGPVNGYSYRCVRSFSTGGSGCPGVSITRQRAEEKLLEWLATAVAPAVDAADPAPQRHGAGDGGRARAVRERARLEAELENLRGALARLRADRAMNPGEYGDGEYEAARDRIRERQAGAEAELVQVRVVEETPVLEDYEPLVVGLLEEWETLPAGERASILRRVLRRAVVYRVERPGLKRATSRIEFHPMWKPDPWAAEKPTGFGVIEA